MMMFLFFNNGFLINIYFKVAPYSFQFEEYSWFRVNFLNNFYVLEQQTALSYKIYY